MHCPLQRTSTGAGRTLEPCIASGPRPVKRARRNDPTVGPQCRLCRKQRLWAHYEASSADDDRRIVPLHAFPVGGDTRDRYALCGTQRAAVSPWLRGMNGCFGPLIHKVSGPFSWGSTVVLGPIELRHSWLASPRSALLACGAFCFQRTRALFIRAHAVQQSVQLVEDRARSMARRRLA